MKDITLEKQHIPEVLAKPITSSPTSPHILLIDGNIKQRDVLLSLLKTTLHFKTTPMRSENEALHYFGENRAEVDLVLLDVSTVEEGCRLIVELQNIKPDLPIIVLVKYGDYQAAAEALLLGAQDFLTKPVAETRMSVTLRNAILLRNARREARRAHTAQAMSGHHTDAAAPNTSPSLISLLNSEGHARKIQDIEMTAIRFAVQFYKGRMTEVARKLGIGRSTLYRKLGHIGSDSPDVIHSA
jgi:DNA-binding NtrC family response regulator